MIVYSKSLLESDLNCNRRLNLMESKFELSTIRCVGPHRQSLVYRLKKGKGVKSHSVTHSATYKFERVENVSKLQLKIYYKPSVKMCVCA